MKVFMRIYRRKSGVWYFSLGRGQKKSLRTKDKREATRLYNIIKKEYLKGRLVQLDGDKRITLSEFKDVFFERHIDIGNDTTRAYDLAGRLFIESTGGSTLLSRINEKHIGKFKSDCLSRGCKKNTVNTYLRHLRGILNKAHEWGAIQNKVPVKLYRIPKRHPRTLAKEERKAILNYSKKNDPEMHRIIKFTLWTGLRRKEIASLTWQNVYDDTARIIGKGDKERTIPLLPKAKKAMGPKKDIGYVFHHWGDLNRYSKAFKKIARAVGIEDATLHNLRHTAATHMVESGMDYSVIQEVMGHADFRTTQIYIRLNKEFLIKEMEKLKY